MFSFHKPKIYRSNMGCCICKAKSSSSRFTDSQKYENEFERCFRIQEKRSGEICNACVLLVKRWKKLSPENRLTKHWHHVVDARAGPGTKLSGNRRIVNHQSSAGSGSQQSLSTSKAYQKSTNSSNRSDVLPLSSSQTNNQSSASGSGGPSRTRTSSFSKARAIDTNISTFTFGEPPSAYRRNYMTSESASYSAFSSLSPLSSSNQSLSGIAKPQSALNSSAFESVIKRFRQRQQQQYLEQQRRQINRQQRLIVRQQQSDGSAEAKNRPFEGDNKSSSSEQSRNVVSLEDPTQAKRAKRLSENYGSFASYDSLKVASVLDSSIWRKEKICCGIIFRGLYNEVAIFPKLLKPCECRMRKIAAGDEDVDETADKLPQTPTEDQDNSLLKKDIAGSESPPPRAAKSGSISSSTSGTGSMEQTIDETQRKVRQVARNQPVAKRPRSVPTKKRRQQKDCDGSGSSEISNLYSKESTSADSPGSGTSSSGNSSSRMILVIDGEHVIRGEVDEDDDLVLADALESSNDASSSAESLLEIEGKNSSALAMG